MTTPVPEPETRHVDSSMFAGEWLRGRPQIAIRTMPVIAVVRELLSVLRDNQIPARQAHTTLRRAVCLLGVFTAETGRQYGRQDETDPEHMRTWAPTRGQIEQSTESAQFAVAWLRGSSQHTIRTEPVIAVVERLLTMLVDRSTPARDALSGLRRAVRLLSVFADDDEHDQRRHGAAPGTRHSDL